MQYLTKGRLGRVWLSLYETYESCDGMIIASPMVYESEAIVATKEWFAESNRPVWAVGPLPVSSGSHQAIAGEEAQSERSADIRGFMDGVLTSHGERSMLYVRVDTILVAASSV